jgi:hypothetical protein
MGIRAGCVAVGLAVVLGGGCSGPGGTAKLTAGQEAGTSETATAPQQPPPVGPGVEIGKQYDFQLYTHCGIEWAHIDGGWWRTSPRNDGQGNPPRGWGNPFDDGHLTIKDHDTAEFVGANGIDKIELRRTEGPGPQMHCA